MSSDNPPQMVVIDQLLFPVFLMQTTTVYNSIKVKKDTLWLCF